MTRILFITSTRIGDAVLSFGLIDHILKTYPEPRLTIVCGHLPSSLFAGVPNLDELIVLKKQPYKRHWLELWRWVIGTKWDVVVDLRNSLVSRLIRADQRFIHGRHIDENQHKVKQNAQVMRLNTVPLPRLWISEAQAAKAAELIPTGGKVIGVGPTANWIGKTWPVERFIEIIKFLRAADGAFPDARVAVFAAPGEEAAACEVLQSVPEASRIDVIAKVDPGTAAAALARVDFYIGNDSGLMHSAAAAGVPTFGLFGASYDTIYAPYGVCTAYLRTPETFDELIDFPGYDPKTLKHSLMTSLSVDAVKQGITRFLSQMRS